MKPDFSNKSSEKNRKNCKSLFEVVQKPYIRVFIFFITIILFLIAVLDFACPGVLVKEKSLRDFDAFYISGLLFIDEKLVNAYTYEYLFPYQQEFSQTTDSMSWTYPLHFNLVTAILGLFPIWIAYIIFLLPSLLGFIWVLRKLAGEQAVYVFLVVFPMVAVCLRVGQSGLLIAFLMGLFVHMIIIQSRKSWIPLTFLTFKPHFMIGVVLFLAVKRQWRTLFLSACATSVLLILVTILGGFDVWPAFFNAVEESSKLLAQGKYKLRRMFSYYAMFRSMDVSASISMMIQFLSGILWLGAAGFAIFRKWCLRHILATAIFASIFLSPYAYDYDLLIFGIGLSLLMPEIAKKASNFEGLFMIFLSYTGFVVSLLKIDLPSFGAVVATTLCVMSLVIARRVQSGVPNEVETASFEF